MLAVNLRRRSSQQIGRSFNSEYAGFLTAAERQVTDLVVPEQ